MPVVEGLGASGIVYLNNRHHDPTLATFITVDPLVTLTGEAYIYGSANPIAHSDPSGLCSMISGDLWCSGSNYGPSGNGHMSVSSVLPEEDPWKAWGIWQSIGDCSTCEGFDIAGGSGNACLGVSGCAAAAEYILYETAGNPAAASDEQFANAKWIAANYCHYEECGAGNLLAYTNQANLLAAASSVLLVGGGLADDLLNAGAWAGNTSRVGAPIADVNAGHMFRDAVGHIVDTLANRALIQRAQVFGQEVRVTPGGPTTYALRLENGSEVWGEVFRRSITNGGVNIVPRWP